MLTWHGAQKHVVGLLEEYAAIQQIFKHRQQVSKFIRLKGYFGNYLICGISHGCFISPTMNNAIYYEWFYSGDA